MYPLVILTILASFSVAEILLNPRGHWNKSLVEISVLGFGTDYAGIIDDCVMTGAQCTKLIDPSESLFEDRIFASVDNGTWFGFIPPDNSTLPFFAYRMRMRLYVNSTGMMEFEMPSVMTALNSTCEKSLVEVNSTRCFTELQQGLNNVDIQLISQNTTWLPSLSLKFDGDVEFLPLEAALEGPYQVSVITENTFYSVTLPAKLNNTQYSLYINSTQHGFPLTLNYSRGEIEYALVHTRSNLSLFEASLVLIPKNATEIPIQARQVPGSNMTQPMEIRLPAEMTEKTDFEMEGCFSTQNLSLVPGYPEWGSQHAHCDTELSSTTLRIPSMKLPIFNNASLNKDMLISFGSPSMIRLIPPAPISTNRSTSTDGNDPTPIHSLIPSPTPSTHSETQHEQSPDGTSIMGEKSLPLMVIGLIVIGVALVLMVIGYVLHHQHGERHHDLSRHVTHGSESGSGSGGTQIPSLIPLPYYLATSIKSAADESEDDAETHPDNSSSHTQNSHNDDSQSDAGTLHQEQTIGKWHVNEAYEYPVPMRFEPDVERHSLSTLVIEKQ